MRELAQVLAYQDRLDFHLVGAPAAVEAHHTAHQLEPMLLTTGVSPHLRLLPWPRLPGLVQVPQWGRLPPHRQVAAGCQLLLPQARIWSRSRTR